MYQIDQSGKIEQTEKNTVIGYSNGQKFTVLLSNKSKRQLQEAFRKLGLTQVYIYITFACLVYFLVRKFSQKQDFTIDTEYTGKDKLIKENIKKLLIANKKPDHGIYFRRIGNKPKVHYVTHDVFNKEVNPNEIITIRKMVEELKKTDGRLRECLSILVGALPRSYNRNIPYKKHPVKKKR